jgi:hypothetical protein
LLGTHPKLVGLGEIDTVLQMSLAQLESEKVMRCSCGERVATCKFWSPAIAAIQAQPRATMLERYGILIGIFRNLYGDDFQIVDSSKYLGQLRTVNSLTEIDLKVIHLIKDVRGFVVSQRDATNAEMKYHRLPVLFNSTQFSRWLYMHSIKTSGYLFWKWYLRNLAVIRIVKNPPTKHLRVGYDELAQQPQTILPRLFDFLELDVPRPLTFIPRHTNSHAFMGNPMLGDKEKMEGIHYDDRWKNRKDWWGAARVFPYILKFNSQVVYSNLEK